MAAIIEAFNLTKEYHLGDERVHALNDISLEIYPGEMVAIVGNEGSGKSTLLHTLATLQKPDSGLVRLAGLDVAETGEALLGRVRAHKVGFLFQAFNLLPNKTALANVEVSLPQEAMRARDRRQIAEKALEAVGLDNRLNRSPGELSATQRLFVAIARELAHNPEVMFVDEPTRVLESASIESVMGLFQKLNNQGMTVIIATPDAQLARYCRRVVNIADGRAGGDDLVTRRRIIRPSTAPRPPADTDIKEVGVVCPRCNYGNPTKEESCHRCRFPLQLTEEEEQSIEDRLSGAENRWLGVESTSDEGDVPAQSIIAELKEVPVFSELGSKSLIKVIPSLEARSFHKGSTIIRQGEAGDSFYIIRSGNVQVLLEREGRPNLPISQLGPNEGFGEMALLTDQPRSASVVALEDVEVWRLSKAGFDGLLSENLSLALYFNRILVQRLRAIQEKMIP